MLCRVYCACCNGLIVNTITIEVSVSEGIQFFLVGLPDSAVKESQQRIHNALAEYGYKIPGKRIVVNLAPANIKKEGSSFDLTIAIGILCASGQISLNKERRNIKNSLFFTQNENESYANIGSYEDFEKQKFQEKISDDLQKRLEEFIILGELALDGSLRPIVGALPIINHARKCGVKYCILPYDSAIEGVEIDGITIFGANSLKEVIDILLNSDNNERYIVNSPNSKNKEGGFKVVTQDIKRNNDWDFCNIVGQSFAKLGLEIAATGGHNVIMVGSPGSGKTFMAQCIPSILPPMSKDESIQTSEIYSVANLLKNYGGLIKNRPFRAPHHTTTISALVGGGYKGVPGEISLAHNGVLFCDEFAEFERRAIEVLRQPLENGTIEISRVQNKYLYPARFMFVAAMNPCPCGNLFDSPSECKCSTSQIIKYQNKVSGPILDRIDIYLKIRKIDITKMFLLKNNNMNSNNSYSPTQEESSSEIAKRVIRARNIQIERYRDENFFTNAHISQSKISKYCALGEKEKLFLSKVISSLKISARGYIRILKIARTIADLKGEERINCEHLSLALQLRFPEQSVM